MATIPFNDVSHEYSATSSYKIGHIVTIFDGQVTYRCRIAAAAGESPFTDPAKWLPLESLLTCIVQGDTPIINVDPTK